MRRYLLAAFASLLAFQGGFAAAQSARALGMGGVRAGQEAADLNPAYRALPAAGARIEIPLPLSLIALLTDPRLDPTSETFDALTLLDQLSHPFTWVLTPAVSPDEILVRIGQDEDGLPTVAIEFLGGSRLSLASLGGLAYHQHTDLLVPLPLGQVLIGLRPYIGLDTDLTLDADLSGLFRSGASGGMLGATLGAEAGVALEVSGGFPLPIPASPSFPGRLYLGGRVAPFIGLAKVEGDLTGTVATELSGDTVEVTYSYQGDLFVSSVTSGQVGFGASADLGVVAALDLPEGAATFGVAVRNLGVEWWPGTSFTLSGDESGGDPLGSGVTTSRLFAVDGLSLTASAGIALSPETLGTPLLQGLLVAADVDTNFGYAEGHLGVEAAFAAFPAVVFARAGIGFENGFVFGIGSGVAIAGIGFDVALHGYRSPFTSRQALGVAASLVFGF